MDLTELINLIPANIGDLAQWLTGIAAFAFLVAYVYERWAWFQNRTGKVKKRFVLGTAFFLPLIGYALGYLFWRADPAVFGQPNLPLDGSFGVWLQWGWNHIIQSFLIYAGTQYVHAKDPAYLDRANGASIDKHIILG